MELLVLFVLVGIPLMAFGVAASMISQKSIRLSLVALIVIAAVGMGAAGGNILVHFSYNVSFGNDAKTLLRTVVADLRQGDCARSARNLERLESLYRPTYEDGPSYFQRAVQVYRTSVEQPDANLLERLQTIP